MVNGMLNAAGTLQCPLVSRMNTSFLLCTVLFSAEKKTKDITFYWYIPVQRTNSCWSLLIRCNWPRSSSEGWGQLSAILEALALFIFTRWVKGM